MSGIFAVFTPDCVSFCEVSSHAANSKGRRLRFLGSHRRIQNLRCRKRPNFEQRGCFHQRAGPWSLVGFLVQHQVNVVLCGGIGAGAQAALAQAGIQLFGGISGSADAAAADYLAGRLVFDSNAHCNHHAHEAEHACGSHSCHEDKGGCAGSYH